MCPPAPALALAPARAACGLDRPAVSIAPNRNEQSGSNFQSVKRSASHDKSDSLNFHSTASRGMGRSGVKMLEGVQELDGISAQDDEQNRLYHEEYGSQVSQEDGDRQEKTASGVGLLIFVLCMRSIYME